MDESTFETFEEELGPTQQDIRHPKPPRQTRRPDMFPQRRVREEPQVFQQFPKQFQPREAAVSRGVSRKPSPIQDTEQTETPWEGVTLNRCLFIAITILVLSSGCHRLHDFVRGRKEGTDIEPSGSVLNVRHSALRKYRLPAPEPETSLWETFFWWVSDDDDDDEGGGGGRRGKSRKVNRGLRHKAVPDRKLLKDREGRFKARRDKARREAEKSRERATTQQEEVKREGEMKLEDGEREKKKEKKNALKERSKKAS